MTAMFWLLLSTASACTDVPAHLQTHELIADYKYVKAGSNEGRGIGFSGNHATSLEKCRALAEERFEAYTDLQTDGFFLEKLSLTCRDLRDGSETVFISF